MLLKKKHYSLFGNNFRKSEFIFEITAYENNKK